MNFIILLSLVFYGVTATPISTTNDNQRIVGGFDASPKQFPYQASIRNESLRHICGGSIISNQWILTSASCVVAVKPSNIRVVVGSIYLDSGGTTYTVVIALEHPDYNDTVIVNDIGLLRVKGKISFNDFVQPIGLFSGDTPEGLILTVTGWGAKTVWNISLSNTLQYVNLRAKHRNDCMNPLLWDNQMCTGRFNSTKQGLCIGDKGNPLVHNGQQHAVSSATLYCLFSFPDVHTRVSSFRDWIKDVTDV